MAKAKDSVKPKKAKKSKADKETKALVRETLKSKAKKKGKAVEVEDDDEDVKPRKGKKSKNDEEDAVAFNPYAHFDNVLDHVAKKLSDADSLDDMDAMSSGSLALNLVSGGIKAAWYTNFGPEQSAKTTGALLIMSAGVLQGVPLLALRDFEGSTGNSIPYVQSIMKTNGVNLTKDELFGKKDGKTGKWIVRPRVRYSASTRGVGFFNWFVSVLSRLPDKKLLNNEWWLVYEDTKENQAAMGEHADKTLPKKYGKGIYIKAPDGGLQGIVMLDSYPNMNPDYKDEEEGDNSLALQARMFSKNLPRVKGYLASKKVAVIGVNQLRDVPMAMYGPSEQEPCGKAIRYNSDVRIRWYPRAINDSTPLWPVKAKKGGLEVEKGIHGGIDKYKYINIQGSKNKLAVAGREGWIRLWTKDADGVAHGIDPVFDTIYYLWVTGQLVSAGRGQKRKAFTLQIGKHKAAKTVNWDDLKMMILGSKKEITEVCKRIGFKPMPIRQACFKQWASGEGELLYAAHEKSLEGAKKSTDDDDDD